MIQLIKAHKCDFHQRFPYKQGRKVILAKCNEANEAIVAMKGLPPGNKGKTRACFACACF